MKNDMGEEERMNIHKNLSVLEYLTMKIGAKNITKDISELIVDGLKDKGEQK